MVVQVTIDGENVVGEQIAQRQDEPAEQMQIAIVSAVPRDLAVETLTEVRNKLQETLKLQEDAAELLQQDKTDQAFELLGAIIEIWLQTQQAVLQCCQLVGVDFAELRVDGTPAEQLTEQLLAQLRELKDLIERADSSALADALGDTWPEIVHQWDGLLNVLIRTIENPPPQSPVNAE